MFANADRVRIAISDIIPEAIPEAVRSFAKANSVEISVVSIGSLPAMSALEQGEILLAVIAVPEGRELTGNTLKEIPFAYSTAVIVVSETNPINEISFYEMRGIFSADTDLSIETWEALGVPGLADRLIKPLIVREETGTSAELFRHTVLPGDSIKLTVNEVIGSEIKEILASNIASVAVLPHLPDAEKIKPLMVSVNPDSPAFGPTNDNVYYGDYPIRLPFQIIYKEESESELKETLRILLSDEVTEILRANHLFVLPDTIRKSFVNGFDLIN